MEQVFGPSLCQWNVWQCKVSPLQIREATQQQQSSIRWQLPHDLGALQLHVPEQELPFLATALSHKRAMLSRAMRLAVMTTRPPRGRSRLQLHTMFQTC